MLRTCCWGVPSSGIVIPLFVTRWVRRALESCECCSPRERRSRSQHRSPWPGGRRKRFSGSSNHGRGCSPMPGLTGLWRRTVGAARDPGVFASRGGDNTLRNSRRAYLFFSRAQTCTFYGSCRIVVGIGLAAKHLERYSQWLTVHAISRRAIRNRCSTPATTGALAIRMAMLQAAAVSRKAPRIRQTTAGRASGVEYAGMNRVCCGRRAGISFAVRWAASLAAHSGIATESYPLDGGLMLPDSSLLNAALTAARRR